MKDWISENYGDENNPSYDRLRMIVMEARDQAFGDDKVRELADEMQKRCDGITEANGNYIPY